MKNLILTFATLLLTSFGISSHAQSPTEGVITYEVRVNIHRGIPQDREGMKAMVPEFRTFRQQLFFTNKTSQYKPLLEDEDEAEMSRPAGGGGGGRFRMSRMKVYSDINSDVTLTEQESAGKNYIIVDTLQTVPWKFGTETKAIAGYDCKQAFYTTTDERPQVITAWYTEKIRPLLGPDRFNTLPGTVLAVDTNNGERVIIAQTVEFKALKKNDIKMPEKGEMIGRKAFRTIAEEQRKLMGGGNRGMRN